MSGVYFFESYNAPSERGFVLGLGKYLSNRFGGEEVLIVSERLDLGEKDERFSLDVMEVCGNTMDSVSVSNLDEVRALCNSFAVNRGFILFNTHDFISKTLLGKESLEFKPMYGRDCVFFLDRSKEGSAFNDVVLTDQIDKQRIYRLGNEADEVLVMEQIRKDIIYSIQPLTERTDTMLHAVDDSGALYPKTNAQTHVGNIGDSEGVPVHKLIEEMIRELEDKQGYLKDDSHMVAGCVRRNNDRCIELLTECAKLQRQNGLYLSTIGLLRKTKTPPNVEKLRKQG